MQTSRSPREKRFTFLDRLSKEDKQKLLDLLGDDLRSRTVQVKDRIQGSLNH